MLLTCAGLAMAGFVPGASGAERRGPTDVSAGGYRYVSDNVGVSDNTQEGQEVVCPGDEPVVGGGALTNSTFAQRVEINTSRPYDADADDRLDDGWIAYVDNINSSDVIGVSLAVFAICDKRAEESDYRYVTRPQVDSPEGSQTGAKANCPGKEPVTGGGVSSSGFLNDEMRINTTQPFDDGDAKEVPEDGWITYVDNEMVGAFDQFIVPFAICDKRRAPSSYKYKQFAQLAPDDTQTETGVECPASARLVSGGLRSSGAYDQRMIAVKTHPHDTSGDSKPDSWIAAINNLSGGGNFQTVTALAVCRK